MLDGVAVLSLEDVDLTPIRSNDTGQRIQLPGPLDLLSGFLESSRECESSSVALVRWGIAWVHFDRLPEGFFGTLPVPLVVQLPYAQCGVDLGEIGVQLESLADRRAREYS